MFYATAAPSTTAPNTTVTAGNDTATTTTAASDDGGGTEPPGQPDVGETGSFTVNGTEFAVTTLNRCIPFQDAPGNVDLQALAGGAKLNLVQFGGVTEVSVDGSTINEMFGSIAFGEAPVVAASDIAGDRWTGSATVGDSLGSSETVEVTWDVMVPAEARDCSL